MARTLEELVFRLTADNSRLKAKLKESETIGKRAADGMKKAFRGFLPAASVAGIGLLAKQLGEAAKEAIDFADNIEKTASKLGVTTDFLQEMRFAADQSGVAINTVDLALQRYARRANEAANGTGEARGAIAELGVALRNTNGSLRSVEDTFTDTLAALAGIEDPSERLRLAFKLFDSEGVAVVNLAARFGELRKEARELGVVMDEELIKQASEAKGQIDALSQVARTSLNSALISLGPTLATLASGFAEVAKSVAEVVDGFRDLNNLGRTGLKSRIAEAQDRLTVARAGLLAAGGREDQDERALAGTTIGDRLRDIRVAKVELNALETRLKQLDVAAEKSRTAATLPGSAVAVTDSKYKGDRDAEDLINQLQNVEAVRRATFAATLTGIEEEIFNNDRLLQSLKKGEQAYIDTAAAIAAENEVKRLGVDLSSEEGEFLLQRLTLAEQLAAQVEKARKESEDGFKAIKDVGTDAASSLGDAFADFATGAEVSLDRIGKAIIRNLIANEAQSLLLGAFGLTPGQSILSGLFGKAAGGRVTGPNIVGENGPEVFVPDVAGQIVPLRAASLGGGGEVNVTVINNSREPVQTRSDQSGPTRRDLMIMIGETTNQNISNGVHDGVLRKRFGQRPVGV